MGTHGVHMIVMQQPSSEDEEDQNDSESDPKVDAHQRGPLATVPKSEPAYRFQQPFMNSAALTALAENAAAKMTSSRIKNIAHRPQSYSASRFTADAFAFFVLNQSGERPIVRQNECQQ